MFTQDGALVLHLKMTHIPLKVPDDHLRIYAHGFSFWKEQMQNLNCKIKVDLQGAKYEIQHHLEYQEGQGAEQCP